MSLGTVLFIMINCFFLYSAISTAAIEMLMGESGSSQARIPEIMGDAAYSILTKSSRTATGQFFIDEYILVQKEGITDLTPYSVVPGEHVTCRQIRVVCTCMYMYCTERLSVGNLEFWQVKVNFALIHHYLHLLPLLPLCLRLATIHRLKY